MKFYFEIGKTNKTLPKIYTSLIKKHVNIGGVVLNWVEDIG